MRLLLALALAGVIIFLLARSRIRSVGAPAEEIRASDARARIDAFLAKAPGPGAFLVFLTERTGVDGGAGFAQVSIEDDGVGVDHVLTCKVNEETAASFREVARATGLALTERRMNDVSYLRVRAPSAAAFCVRVLSDVYEVAPDSRLEVIESAG